MQVPELGKLLSESTVRLAVTGLSGAGKTVFLTSLVHNLLAASGNPAVLPLFRSRLKGGLVAVRVEGTPDRPAFPYERLLESLAADPPRWPPSTTGASELRLSVRYRPRSALWSRLAPLSTLHVELVDYPGEWLLDLPLLEQGFEEWSAATMALAREEPRRSLASRWLDFVAGAPPPGDESARAAVELYAEYLRRCRVEHGLSLLQPGRLLSPGDLAASPLILLCPVPRGSALAPLMRERYERYREEVVKRFYAEHFVRIDRQVVLVDVLRALNIGRAAFTDAQRALRAVLKSFDFGRTGFLRRLLGGARVDKVLFLATKADHVAPSQYANLRELLATMMREASGDVVYEGATADAGYVAAVRCTSAGTGTYQGRAVGMVTGILEGETEPSVLYAGEVPPAPPPPEMWETRRPDFPTFRPPRVLPDGKGIPQLGLDAALDFLIGDRFA